MKNIRKGTLAACAVAACLTPSADAQACSYGPGDAEVIWPPPVGEGGEVPIDTHVWVSASGLSPDEVTLRLEDDAGVEVEADLEVVETTRDFGPSSRVMILAPRTNLEPSRRYTIEVTFPSYEGMTRGNTRTFETGAGVSARPQPATPEVTYVAMEGIEVGGDSCDNDGTDAVHALRWRLAPTQGFFMSILRVERVGEGVRTIARTFDAEDATYGDYMFNGDSSVGLEEYPCLTHTLVDVTGREVSSKSTCSPDLCVVPPLTEYGATEYGSPEFRDFIFSPGTWDAMATDCMFATGEPEDAPLNGSEGCATAPASPIPRTPIALGGLALLGLLTRRRSEQ